jgi:hypothetical protein
MSVQISEALCDGIRMRETRLCALMHKRVRRCGEGYA